MYSDHGVDGTGVFPAKDLVSEFWELPEGKTPESYAPKDKRKMKGWNWVKPPRDRRRQFKECCLAGNAHWGHNGAIVIKDKVFLMYEDG